MFLLTHAHKRHLGSTQALSDEIISEEEEDSATGREFILVGWLFLMQYVYKHPRCIANYTGNTPCKYEIISIQ